MAAWNFREYFESGHRVPGVVWCSPLCRTFTITTWASHRDKDGRGTATSDASAHGDACVAACLDVIRHCQTLNPGLIWFVENPLHFAFRRLDCVRPYNRTGQCRSLQYGDTRTLPEGRSVTSTASKRTCKQATFELSSMETIRTAIQPTLVLTNLASWRPRPIAVAGPVTPAPAFKRLFLSRIFDATTISSLSPSS